MFAAYGRNTEAGIKRRTMAPVPKPEAAKLEADILEFKPTRPPTSFHGKRFRFTLDEIERRACQLFGVTRLELHSKRRNRHVVFARQFVMYWSVRLTKLTLPQIGAVMGRDHTTVLHGKDAYVSKRKAMKRTLRRAR